MTEKQQITELELAYGGDAYADNEIDAKTLGRALVSLDELIENAEKILHGEGSDPKITIKATPKGSFTVLISVLGSLSTLQVLGLSAGAGAAVGSVIGVIDWLRGRKPTDVIIDERNGTSKIIVDGEEIVCSRDVQKLVINPVIRKEISQLIYNPLQTEAASVLKIKSGNRSVVTIKQSDSEAFKAPKHTVEQQTHVENLQLNIKFTKLSYKKVTGWMMELPDGEEVTVRMEDEAFLERVKTNSTAFRQDDLFVVDITKTTKESNGKKSNPAYTITKVVRHRAAQERKLV
jgi:hypothetical protein